MQNKYKWPRALLIFHGRFILSLVCARGMNPNFMRFQLYARESTPQFGRICYPDSAHPPTMWIQPLMKCEKSFSDNNARERALKREAREAVLSLRARCGGARLVCNACAVWRKQSDDVLHFGANYNAAMRPWRLQDFQKHTLRFMQTQWKLFSLLAAPAPLRVSQLHSQKRKIIKINDVHCCNKNSIL